GIADLALCKLLGDPESREKVTEGEFLQILKDIPGAEDLTRAEAAELVIESLRSRRDQESPETTARLRLYRQINDIQATEALDREFVDGVIREGEAIVPLLIGVLRSYAQSAVLEEDEWVVENTLALLGEIGSPAALSALFEFTEMEDGDLSGAAGWAIDR